METATVQRKRIEAELQKIGIRTEADLREAIRTLKPMQIGIMVSPIPPMRTGKDKKIYAGLERK